MSDLNATSQLTLLKLILIYLGIQLSVAEAKDMITYSIYSKTPSSFINIRILYEDLHQAANTEVIQVDEDGFSVFTLDDSASELYILKNWDKESNHTLNIKLDLKKQLLSNSETLCFKQKMICIARVESNQDTLIPLRWNIRGQRPSDNPPPGCYACKSIQVSYSTESTEINETISAINYDDTWVIPRHKYGGFVTQVMGQSIRSLDDGVVLEVHPFQALLGPEHTTISVPTKGTKDKLLTRENLQYHLKSLKIVKENLKDGFRYGGTLTHNLTDSQSCDAQSLRSYCVSGEVFTRKKCKKSGKKAYRTKTRKHNSISARLAENLKRKKVNKFTHYGKESYVRISNKVKKTAYLNFKTLKVSADPTDYFTKPFLRPGKTTIYVPYCRASDYEIIDTSDNVINEESSLFSLIDWNSSTMPVIIFDNSAHAMKALKVYDQTIKAIRKWQKKGKYPALFTYAAGGRIAKEGLKSLVASSNVIDQLYSPSDRRSNPRSQVSNVVQEVQLLHKVKKALKIIYVSVYERSVGRSRLTNLVAPDDARVEVIYLDRGSKKKCLRDLGNQANGFRCISPSQLPKTLDSLLATH